MPEELRRARLATFCEQQRPKQSTVAPSSIPGPSAGSRTGSATAKTIDNAHNHHEVREGSSSSRRAYEKLTLVFRESSVSFRRLEL
jgi:hypothetical protein